MSALTRKSVCIKQKKCLYFPEKMSVYPRKSVCIKVLEALIDKGLRPRNIIILEIL